LRRRCARAKRDWREKVQLGKQAPLSRHALGRQARQRLARKEGLVASCLC
jgi:hypothetical protein